MNILRKRVGQPLEVVETSEKYFMDCVKKFFEEGTTIERVYMEGVEFIMAVDEDGLVKGLPLNFFMPFDNPYHPVQAIVGDVVFIRNKYADVWNESIWDFEVLDITEKDIKTIEELLVPARQLVLANKYMERGGIS